MSRKPRVVKPNTYYHVLNRGAGRRYIFNTEQLKNAFIFYLKKTVEKFDVDVSAFCIMGNHYHVLIFNQSDELSAAMRYLNSQFARYYNKTKGKDSPVFKDRFKAIEIRNNAGLTNVTKYIHRNPVEAQLVRCPSEYQWSSIKRYLGVYKKLDWVTPILGGYGFEQYFDFVSKPLKEKISTFYSKSNLRDLFK